MGTWNNLQEGFTVDERLPDTLVDVAVWHVFDRAPQLYRQAPQIKKPPCVTLAGYRTTSIQSNVNATAFEAACAGSPVLAGLPFFCLHYSMTITDFRLFLISFLAAYGEHTFDKYANTSDVTIDGQ